MEGPIAQGINTVQIMQASIAPVTLISGVGLLLLSMTNRYGRAIDRTRDLLRSLQNHEAKTEKKDEHHIKRQIRILYNRAQVMRTAIACGITSIFFTALAVGLIFIQLSAGHDLGGVLEGAFSMALILILVGMGLYLVDIKMSLAALRLEIRAGDEDLI